MTTYNPTLADALAPVRTGSRRPSLFKRVVDGLIAAQERRALVIVQAHLAKHDDATLARLGWTPAAIAALRKSPSAAVLPL